MSIKVEKFVLILVESKELQTESQKGKVMVPLYNIPMMSDERWNELASRQRSEATV